MSISCSAMKITTLKGSPTSETDDDGSLRAASPTRVKTPKNKSKSPSKGKGKSSAGEGEGVESFPELSDKKIAKKQKRKKTEAEEGMSNAEDEDLDATTAVETPKPKVRGICGVWIGKRVCTYTRSTPPLSKKCSGICITAPPNLFITRSVSSVCFYDVVRINTTKIKLQQINASHHISFLDASCL